MTLADGKTCLLIMPRSFYSFARMIGGALGELGYAVTYGELELGLNAVAVPVHDEDGRVIAALSASGPAYRLSPERIAEILSPLVVTATQLSRRMGHWGHQG